MPLWPAAGTAEWIRDHPRAESRAGSLGYRLECCRKRGRVVRTGATATAGLLVATGAVTLPGAALMACLALGIASGALGAAWAWLTADPPDRSTRDVALLTGAVALAGGLALAGMTVLLGPATVIAIPAIYVLAALSVSYRSGRDRRRPGNVR